MMRVVLTALLVVAGIAGLAATDRAFLHWYSQEPGERVVFEQRDAPTYPPPPTAEPERLIPRRDRCPSGQVYRRNGCVQSPLSCTIHEVYDWPSGRCVPLITQ